MQVLSPLPTYQGFAGDISPQSTRPSQPLQQEVEPGEQVCTVTHLLDVVADFAALFSHVCPDIMGCAHWGAHDTEAMNLYYVEIDSKHGRPGRAHGLCG